MSDEEKKVDFETTQDVNDFPEPGPYRPQAERINSDFTHGDDLFIRKAGKKKVVPITKAFDDK